MSKIIINPSNFQPKLFIGVGLKNHYFTLRETYAHPVKGEGDFGGAVVNGEYQGFFEVRSFHHQNLSQNSKEAYEKAIEISENLGLLLDASESAMEEQLAEIHKRNREQMEAARKAEEKEKEEYLALKAEQHQQDLEKIKSGIIPIGKHFGKKFQEVDRTYLNWLIKNMDNFDKESIIFKLAEAVKETMPEMEYPEPKKDLHIGEIKQRLTLNVFVSKSFGVEVPDNYSYAGMKLLYITTMIDVDSGACIVVMSSSFSAKEGTNIKIVGTVKEHSEYKGQAQTILQRVKVKT